MSFLMDVVWGVLFLALGAGVVLCQDSLSMADEEEILNLHNFLRGMVNPTATNMEQMVWSNELAQVAQTYAEQCENLAAGSGPANYTDSVIRWYNEVSDYIYASNTCTAVCGHYTQVVWATSNNLGCGAKRCSTLTNVPNVPNAMNWLILVCNYGPTGNFVGQKPYLSGSPCSACPTGKPHCSNDICTAEYQPITPMNQATDSNEATNAAASNESKATTTRMSAAATATGESLTFNKLFLIFILPLISNLGV